MAKPSMKVQKTSKKPAKKVQKKPAKKVQRPAAATKTMAPPAAAAATTGSTIYWKTFDTEYVAPIQGVWTKHTLVGQFHDMLNKKMNEQWRRTAL